GADGEGRVRVEGTFAVEEYRKPEYEVTVTPDRERAVQGDRVRVKVRARYLFGGAPSGARVTYNVTRAPYYPPGFDAEDLPPGEDRPRLRLRPRRPRRDAPRRARRARPRPPAGARLGRPSRELPRGGRGGGRDETQRERLRA
ncbi:hypothetical protein, partial [Deinococcus pimensis]|uniref:hypothetical protein n=1 Tax=Deinococcus pimensis TaxID=309888 RepID=UPI00146FC648